MELAQLEAQIKVVAEARQIAQEASTKRVEALTAWQEENKALYTNESVTKGCCELQEAELRKLTLEAYAEDPTNKAPAPGVGIKVMTVLTYDAKVALQWGIDHHGIALKLDTKAFETVVKATPSVVDFVRIISEPQATIATNLDKVE